MIPIRDTSPTKSTPIVTYSLIAANILIFSYSMLLPEPELRQFIQTYAIIPRQIGQGMALSSIFTSMFLHGSLGHLISNMLFLNIFGDNLEDHLGHIKYLLFYLISGLGGALLQLVFNLNSTVPNLGASGAIAGLMGAYLVLFPYHEIETLFFWGFFVRMVKVPAAVMLIYWILAQFLSGLGQLGLTGAEGGIAYLAHVGGFLTGYLLIQLFGSKQNQNTLATQA